MAGDELRVIGTVQVLAGGEPVELPPQQAKVLAVLAAARPGQSVARAELVDALWPAAPEPDRLWVVVSKLRTILRRVGVTVSSGRGHAGYMLLPDGADGADPAELLDVAAVARLIDRGEQLLDEGEPAEAVVVLRAAAAHWRGVAFTVADDDWPLPRICRLAVERLDAQQQRLARHWARAGLLLGDRGVLEWVDQDKDLAAAVEADRQIWLLRFVAALADDNPALAEGLLEDRRPGWGYGDPMTVRAAQLLELRERGAVLPRLPRTPPAPGPCHAELAGFVGSIRTGRAELLRLVGPAGPARAALTEELTAVAEQAGVRVVYALSDGADNLAPGRPLMRDLWTAALCDPQYSPETNFTLLSEIVARPRPGRTGRVGQQAPQRLVEAAVTLVAALARSRPVLIVIDSADLLSDLAAALTEEIRARLGGVAAAFALPGADAGPYAGWSSGVVLAVASERPRRPDASDWLAAAAVTAVGTAVDPLVVAAVLEVPTDRGDAGLAAAVRSGAVVLGDPARFASARVRDDVLAELAADPGRARRLHAAAYRHLRSRPGPRPADPARIARHALAARPAVGDAEVAAACLAAAEGERAARRQDEVLEFAVRGLALTDDPRLRFALQLVQGDARHDRADMHAAQSAYRAAYDEAGDDPRLRAIATVRLARRWTDPGRTDPWLLHMLRTSRDELAGATDPELHELRLLLGAYLAHNTTMALLPADPPGAAPEGVALARDTLGALTPRTTPAVACEVLAECRWALYDFAPPAEIRAISARLAEVAAATDEPHFHGEALIHTVVDELRLGELVTAHAAGEQHRVHVIRTGQGLGPWYQLTLDTIFDLWEGDLADAEARILGPQRVMLDERPRDVSDSLHQTWMAQVFWLFREQGRTAQLVGLGVAQMAERRRSFPVWGAAMALLNADVGRYSAAVDQIVAFLDQTADLRALPPHGWTVPALAVLAEAIDSLRGHRSDRLDVPALARRIDAMLEPHSDETVLGGWPSLLLGPARRARGLLALATGRHEAAAEHFERALREVGAASAQLGWLRLFQGRALLDCPSARRAGRPRELFEAAVDTATTKNMDALRAAARRELDALR